MFNFKGYVITRKLYNDKNQLENVAFYPKTKGGKSPYVYKTKAQAERILKNKKLLGKSYFGQDSKVVKYTKKTYIDRF